MDSNSLSSTTAFLEWENLALFNGANPIHHHHHHPHFPMNPSNSSSSSKYHHHHHHHHHHQQYDNHAIAEASDSPDPIIGLRLGSQNEYRHDHHSFLLPSTKSSVPVSSMPAKRSRASYQNMQNPCCQVEGCNLDLKSAKDYHRRHRICETHSKSPKVIVAGNERRFCQQCSRFHDLSEFDDKKRSCRRRLSDHNARRRRVQPESIQLTSTGLPPALYDHRKQNLLLSGLPVSLRNPTWENVMSRSHDDTNNIHNSVSNLHMDSDRFSTVHSSNHHRVVLDQCLHTNSSIGPDLLNAHSLLSSNVWGYNDGEPTSIDGLVHGSESLFQSSNVVQSGDLNNGSGSTHHQEYQLFKAPYDSAGFYSSQRYL